jgi:hypothetical protein
VYYKRIYVEGEPHIIDKIKEIAIRYLGEGVNAIDLEPRLKEEE